MTTWLPGVTTRDLSGSCGNGPFTNFLGVILHVNVDENGTPITFWGPGNAASVTPNFQVYKDGTINQMLPFNWQPWCQIDGNFNYAAIETAGLPTEPLTDAQCASIARILAVYHAEMGMHLAVTDTPGVAGFGTHLMGGTAWGGHDCPGSIRAGQRQHILDLTTGADMPLTSADIDAIWAKSTGTDTGVAYQALHDARQKAAGALTQSAANATALAALNTKLDALTSKVNSMSTGNVDVVALAQAIAAHVGLQAQ